MSLMRWLFIALIALGAWQHWHARPVMALPGRIAPADPTQTSPAKRAIYRVGNYELQPLADFAIEARVLGKEVYHADRESDLAPVDLALGWGAMSDSAVLDKLSISQSGRFYAYRWSEAPPLPPQEIVSHSANMHLVPASATIEKQIKAVRPGQVVRIRGQLIEATAPDGWRWRSSLTREDSGAGACELVRVDEISVR